MLTQFRTSIVGMVMPPAVCSFQYAASLSADARRVAVVCASGAVQYTGSTVSVCAPARLGGSTAATGAGSASRICAWPSATAAASSAGVSTPVGAITVTTTSVSGCNPVAASAGSSSMVSSIVTMGCVTVAAASVPAGLARSPSSTTREKVPDTVVVWVPVT